MVACASYRDVDQRGIHIMHRDSLDSIVTELQQTIRTDDLPSEVFRQLTPEQIEDLAKISIVMGNRGNYENGEGGVPILEAMIPLVGTVVFFACLGFIFWLILRSRRETAREEHEIRLRMVEKGIYDPSIFVKTSQKTDKAPRTVRMMIWGLILALGGLGLTITGIADSGIDDAGIEMAIMFVGIALIVASEYVRRTGVDAGRSTHEDDDTETDDV